jgi:chromosome segregation ATPase
MSDQYLDAFCTNLDAALAENEAQSSAADQEIGSHLAQLARCMEQLAETVRDRKQAEKQLRETIAREVAALRAAFAEGMSSAAGKQERIDQLERVLAEQTEANQAGRRRMDELLRKLEQRDVEVQQYRERLEPFEEELTRLRAERDALVEQLETSRGSEEALAELTAELEQTREELDGLRISAEKVGAAERLLGAERRRANELEERLRQETANGTKAIIAQQLADALRDMETAREEGGALRAELDSLRREVAEKAVEMERVTTPKRPKFDRDQQKRQLGDMLLEAGVISQDQLDLAVAAQAESPQRTLADILVDQGAAEEEVVAQAAAAQHRVLYVHLNEQSVDPAAAALITPKIAHQHRCVPVRATEDALVLAMADPMNVIAIEDVERASSRSVRPVMATQSAIEATIGRLYHGAEEQV